MWVAAKRRSLSARTSAWTWTIAHRRAVKRAKAGEPALIDTITQER